MVGNGDVALGGDPVGPERKALNVAGSSCTLLCVTDDTSTLAQCGTTSRRDQEY